MEKRITSPAFADLIEKAKAFKAMQPQSAAKPAQPAAKPNPYANNMLSLLSGAADGVIVKSCTEGSEKRFRLCVDDEGNISAVEV